jgi:hypothetical protein
MAGNANKWLVKALALDKPAIKKPAKKVIKTDNPRASKPVIGIKTLRGVRR